MMVEMNSTLRQARDFCASAPDLARAFQFLSRLGCLVDQQVQVVVLRGLGQAVKSFTCFHVMSHSFQASCDRYLVVRQAGGYKGILIPLGASCTVALVIVALQISILSGIASIEPDVHGRPEVGQVTSIQIIYFSSLPAYQQALGTYPGKVLVRGEIKDGKLLVKAKVSDRTEWIRFLSLLKEDRRDRGRPPVAI